MGQSIDTYPDDKEGREDRHEGAQAMLLSKLGVYNVLY
jgi:hypothetical protein